MSDRLERAPSQYAEPQPRKSVTWRCRAACALTALSALGLAMPAAARAVPANVGDAVAAATAYHDNGSYDRDFASVMEEASEWVRIHAPHVRKPAVVLDIDETSLSNWPEIQANHFAYFRDGRCDALPKGPCGVVAWETSARAEAFPSTLAFYRMARQHDVAVFFVTGRSESERADTVRNLEAAGYHDWAGLALRPEGSHTASASEYKTLERKKIEAAGYRIVATIGDQPSDLAGGHAERGFLLPNPFYRVP